jgi:GPI-anchor transamidase subunit K
MNALGIYQLLRKNDIPDDNIILMIANEYAINSRNPYKNRMHASGVYQESWYDHQTQIDYRGADVTVQNFIDALLGRASKSLHSNHDSNVLIYLTGHGGDQASTVGPLVDNDYNIFQNLLVVSLDFACPLLLSVH